ncbi:hypothetical protein D3C72_1765380 [compost metagenome]
MPSTSAVNCAPTGRTMVRASGLAASADVVHTPRVSSPRNNLALASSATQPSGWVATLKLRKRVALNLLLLKPMLYCWKVPSLSLMNASTPPLAG